MLYHQKIYDSTAGWCYYSLSTITATPLVGDTTPNHTNNLVASSHVVLESSSEDEISALVAPSYVAVSAEATLTNERVLTAGTGITITDGGAGGPLTVASTVTSGAPVSAQYVTLATDGTLTNERVLTAGTGISITDGGAGAAVTIAATGTAAPVGAQYVTLATDATLTSERVLTAGTGISLTDGGAGSTLTVATTVDPAPKSAQYVTLATDATLTSERVLTAGTGISITDGGAGGSVTIAATGTSAPVGASYVTLGTDATLTSERVLTAGTGISLTDGGAGSTLTVATTVDPAPKDAQYVTLAANTTLTGERVLTAGTGISITDGGANSTVTIASTVTQGAPVGAQYVTLATDGTLTSERVLTAGSGISIVDGGAGAAVTISATGGSSLLWEWNRTDVSQFTVYSDTASTSIAYDTSATVGGRPKIKLTLSGTDKSIIFINSLTLPRRYRMRLAFAFNNGLGNFQGGPMWAAYNGGAFASCVGHCINWPANGANPNGIYIIEGTNVIASTWTNSSGIAANNAVPSSISGRMMEMIIDHEAESTTVNSTVDNVRMGWQVRDNGNIARAGCFERSGTYTGATWNGKSLVNAGLFVSAQSTSGIMVVENFRIEKHPLDL